MKGLILKILNRQYESLSLIECILKHYDLAFKTDEKGHPFVLFLGKKEPKGFIRCEGYVRELAYDAQGNVKKGRWKRKRKAS